MKFYKDSKKFKTKSSFFIGVSTKTGKYCWIDIKEEILIEADFYPFNGYNNITKTKMTKEELINFTEQINKQYETIRNNRSRKVYKNAINLLRQNESNNK